MITSTNNLDPLTSYSVTVEAINKDGLVGNASDPVLFTTVEASIPGKPTNLVISKTTGGALYMLMNDPLDVGGSPILTYALLMTSAQYPTILRQVYQGPSPHFNATHLTFSTTYRLQYKVTNSVGTSELSDVVIATTNYLSIPDEAQNIVALSRTGGSVTLSWTPPFDFGGADITAYDVSFFLGTPIRSQFRQRVSGINPNATSVTAKVVGLLANSNYGFSVAGVNDVSVCEDPSVIVTRTIVYSSTYPLVTLPDTPRGLTIAQSTSGMQSIQWSASEDTGGSYFVAYILYSNIGEILYNGPLHAGTVYYFAVSAVSSVDTIGEGTRSSTTQVLTNPATLPSIPLNFAVGLRTSFSVFLKWDGPIDTGGDDVFYETSYINTNTSESLGVMTLSTTTVEIPKLIPGNIYLFQLRSRNSAGSSEWTVGLATQTDVTQRGIITFKLASSTVYENVSSVTVDLLRVNGSSGTVTCSYTDGLGTAVYVPIDAGGSPIAGYLIYISEHDVGYQLAYNGTGQPTHVMIPVSVGKPDTRYAFQAQAVNFVGAGDTSDAFYFVSGPISRPGPPRLPSTYSATGGSISITLQPLLDTGGQEDISYMIYYREQGSGTRFRKAYCNAQDLEITIFRVAASTVYDLVAVSVLEEDANQLTMGTINISDSSIVLDDNVTSDIMNSGFFEFCDFIFEVDTTQTQDGNTIQYLELLSTGDSAPASMRLDSGDSCGVYVRGAFSLSSDFATTSITKPGVPPAPTESDYSDNTGGALFIAISWPDDIGGVPITGYEFYLDNQTVKGELKGYQNTTMFDLSVTVEIGGLKPNTAYSFYYILTNDASACESKTEDDPEQFIFSTGEASLPSMIPLIQSIGATGGGIHVAVTPPNDKGSDEELYYQIYMGESRTTKNWKLGYNDYVVTLVAYNPVGASPPSAVTPFTTKVTSLPQAPQGVHVAEVSNTSVTIHWDPCLDFGGGYVETYQVDIVQTLNTSIAFSGRVPVAQLNYSMDGLTPSTDYSTTVRAVTGDSQLGNASKVVFFRTPQFANQPRPPAVGCHSRTVANVYWKAEDDAISYLLYRNGQLLHDNGEEVTFEDAITLGKTYSYQVRVRRLDGSLSDPSEATQFFASTPVSSGFDCNETEGYIHWHEYRNSDHETWTIIPQNQAGIVITATMFWLECNHDSLTISITTNANEGGGLYAQNNVMVHGDEESTIWNNTAALNGGGICVWGSLTGTTLNLLQNTASVGAGMAASSGSSVLSQVKITQNHAFNDGGGIALLNTASLILYYSPIRMNHAERYGGGVYVGSNGTFENKAASEIFNCTAASGGGFYGGDWAQPTVNTLNVLASSATTTGGCAAFSRSSAILNNPLLDGCTAPAGGGLFAATSGGGLFFGSGANCVLRSSRVANNNATESGGGLTVQDAKLYHSNLDITKNAAPTAGGVNIRSDSVISSLLCAQASFDYVEVIFSECSTSGGGVFVETSAVVTARNSHISNNFADDSGGGIYIDTGDQNVVNLTDSYVESNMAHGEGCGVYVGREADFAGFRSHFVGNGGVTSSGKNEGGGAISTVDGSVELTDCTLANNTALVGGAIHVDRGGSAEVINSLFAGNTADEIDKQGICERCPRNTYSLEGIECFDCPPGARCNMTVRRATQLIGEELGTVSPRTEEGYYLFSAPASKRTTSCLKPTQWKKDDPCKPLALENPAANVSEVIYNCSNLNDFNVYWPAERLFSCLSGNSFYTCDISSACEADVSLQTLTLASSVNNASCASGYDLAICSVCAKGFKRAQDNSCLPCEKANQEVRASVRWQNFVIPVMMAIAFVAGIYGVRVYLRDLTEIGLLSKAEADRRLKPPNPKKGENLALRASMSYRRHSMAVMGRADRVKDKIKGILKKYQNRNAKMLFGIDVSPPARTFPVTPSKFKIFIGFFQIFGNFQSSFVVKWSSNIQSFMSFSQKFNLDLVAIAGIDCVVTKTFYFDFTVTVCLVVIVLTVITAYFYAGMRSYRTKLQLIPRNCLRCGLPVFEGEVIRNDDESFNPLLLLQSWWRTHNFYKHGTSASAEEKTKGGSENDSTVALSTVKESRSLKRKFGMSQVRTPYLGLFRSQHANCPVKRHVLSGAMLDRTIRSNLRVWQARVKLRMNYLTYRNKCLKLYCWMALFLYPSVSKTILAVYNCQEVGDTYYLVADRRLVCYNGEWALFGIIATIGVVVWVVGIPFFFGLLIWLAQDRGVAARLRLLKKPQMRVQRQKWLKEVEEQQIADGRFVRNMDNNEVQDEELAKYMKRKNLTDSTVQARLGFIYAEYSNDYWWFEVVDLSRKLFLSGVIVFVENGSVEQVLLALAVCLVTMWFLLYFQPYEGYSDNLIASITQLQLFFTLWLGVMITLNNLNTESLINVDLLSIVLVGTCIAVTAFGLSMIVGEGLTESRRIYTETVAQRKKQLKGEIRKRWIKAFNYAAYEAQMLRYDSRFNFPDFSVSAKLEALRRAKLIDEGDPEFASIMPKIEEDVEVSSLDLRLPEMEHANSRQRRRQQ
ncbi:hypothetical protein PF006_g1371 [Phytophthora fragariae]|uniref:Fibronectin type-III domain-containing protein n=1 Tax=Phytophthora fragariae TaxID=53985 RepID=A0A6A3UTF1_9STRA|nr:hypothetical protein PF006_g1371 [Phytophthora fragariae]